MIDTDNTRAAFFVLLAAVVVSSGCIQNSSTDLNSDFDLDHRDVSVNSSGQQIYNESISQVSEISDYSVEADNRMAMNLPVLSVSVNMTSNGLFEQSSYNVNSSGSLGFNLGGNSNSTEFETIISSDDNVTTVYKQTGNDENSTDVERYNKEELGVSLESLQEIDVENASVLGAANLSGEENLLLNLTVNESDLMHNSEQIFEVHSPIQESTEDGQDLSQLDGFDEVKAHLWADRSDRTPSKFAYYGSAGNGSIHVRSVTNYR